MEKKTKILSILICLVILGIPIIAFSQSETQTISDSPLYHIRNNMATKTNTSDFETQYLGQYNHSATIPQIIKILQEKGIILSTSGCTQSWELCTGFTACDPCRVHR